MKKFAHWNFTHKFMSLICPSVFWHCLMGSRKGIQPVKTSMAIPKGDSYLGKLGTWANLDQLQVNGPDQQKLACIFPSLSINIFAQQSKFWAWTCAALIVMYYYDYFALFICALLPADLYQFRTFWCRNCTPVKSLHSSYISVIYIVLSAVAVYL